MQDQKDGAGAPANAAAPGAAALLKDAVAAARAAAPARRAFRLRLKPPVIAGLLGALCLGAFGGGAAAALFGRHPGPAQPAVSRAEWKTLAARIEAGSSDAARLVTDVKLLRDRSAEAHEASERGRTEAGARLGQIAERLERLQRLETELGGKVAALGERLDHADREQAARLAALADRLEKRPAPAQGPAPVAALPAPKPVAAAEPALTGSLPDRPEAKARPAAPGTIEGWVLRDVYDGVAMIENRNRRLLEISPGDSLPGAGRIEAIERRGRTWVVVTSKGLITTQAW
ncbi:hypothetical protein OPKNFCMD_3781 [Methylobacterium crusticola]|uniref:Uncharacterized protein n=1 Tax=Methylobacterium crusticola TaxID=1697972 RepID=A0ABQ4R030_9HYPH|nr:hypothetical protein [Methylobacterium crusticola]GJD51030.1 hypothetical protein OPKNFCMD_3781 [Methylobacterium crusticola]